MDVNSNNDRHKIATFAGGCFWCMVQPFETLKGVSGVLSGYIGGHTVNPTYEEVCTGTTGHFEAVQVIYDASVLPYEALLEVFWRQINPTDLGGQFYDRGPQYQTAIFYHSEEQKLLAVAAKDQLQKAQLFNTPIATKILKAEVFYPAEEYHQGYYKKNPLHYQDYKVGSGRADYLKKTWEGA
jgi:peptide methionine sulfoxide reductase msrA/msrB